MDWDEIRDINNKVLGRAKLKEQAANNFEVYHNITKQIDEVEEYCEGNILIIYEYLDFSNKESLINDYVSIRGREENRIFNKILVYRYPKYKGAY